MNQTDPAPEPDVPDPRRRRFLQGLGLASAAAAAPASGIVDAGPAQALTARPDQRAQRYRESDHIRKYYETNAR